MFNSIEDVQEHYRVDLSATKPRPVEFVEGMKIPKDKRHSYRTMAVGFTMSPLAMSLELSTQRDMYIEVESVERCESESNPGLAWRFFKSKFLKFLTSGGHLPYTYGERMAQGTKRLMERIKAGDESRQLYVAVWQSYDLREAGAAPAMIPCTIGYWFRVRDEYVDMVHDFRSLDIDRLDTDFAIDCRVLKHIALECGKKIGVIGYTVCDLHMFEEGPCPKR